jgi:mono/diheme cytochrome c family protein
MRRLFVPVACVAVTVLAAVAFVWAGGISATRRRPWPFEERVAKTAWRLLVPRSARAARNPLTDTPDVLRGAREHWADHCALCHGNDGSGDTTIGGRVYPKVPDLRAPATQRLSDGELFYAIEQGIPWTAMPGWGTGTSDGERESWALVTFIRHLPSITAGELNEMEKLNPKPPPNLEREKEIDDFLKGK